MNENFIEFWEERRGIFKTRKGGWTMGNGVYSHGYSLLDELLGEKSFFQVMIMHVTGKLPERRLADWLEAAFMCLSWPDPRIWCNYIGSLGGSSKTSSTAAICAGTLAADSRIYGVGTLGVATQFIKRALQRNAEGCSVKAFIENECKKNDTLVVPGFARPLARGDERVEAIQTVVEKLGFTNGPHISLAYDISDYLYKNYNESLNFAGYVVAFLSDQDFTEDEIIRVFSMWVNGGVHACYVEAADRPANSFLPLRCEDIVYTGRPERSIPK